MRRTSLWLNTPFKALATRYGSTPMSIRRSTVPSASLAWRVESTTWPVMAERMAISAVSPSRISPTAMMSGSWRRMERRPLAKVMPIFSLICTWLTPSMLYSTGSSSVTRFTSRVFKSPIMVYMVVDLPEPVGPTIRITPFLIFTSRRYFSRSSPARPMESRLSFLPDLSSRRATIFSPYTVGSVDTRRSMSLSRTFTLKRPSWGTRRSVMSRPDMTFTRLMTAACSSRGTVSMSRSRPSMRMRTENSVSRGSMWMSLARSVTARSMMAFTSLMAGAWETLSSPTWLPEKALSTAAVVSPETAASRFISSMALAAPSLPYST